MLYFSLSSAYFFFKQWLQIKMVLHQCSKEQKQHITGGGWGGGGERGAEFWMCESYWGNFRRPGWRDVKIQKCPPAPPSLSLHTHTAVSSRNLHNAITISDFAKTKKKEVCLVKRKRLMLWTKVCLCVCVCVCVCVCACARSLAEGGISFV